jgi:hypothetical protein
MSLICKVKALLIFLPFTLGCPPQYRDVTCNGGILSTPTYGLDGAVFTVCASVEICGSVKEVSDTILNFRKYEEWNTFIYDADVPDDVATPHDVAPGLAVLFYSTGIQPGVNNTGTDVITFIDRPFYSAWINVENEAFVGVSEHVSTFCPTRGGKTKYTHWQTQYLPQANVLLPIKESLQRQFEAQANDLKAYVERTHKC